MKNFFIHKVAMLINLIVLEYNYKLKLEDGRFGISTSPMGFPFTSVTIEYSALKIENQTVLSARLFDFAKFASLQIALTSSVRNRWVNVESSSAVDAPWANSRRPV